MRHNNNNKHEGEVSGLDLKLGKEVRECTKVHCVCAMWRFESGWLCHTHTLALALDDRRRAEERQRFVVNVSQFAANKAQKASVCVSQAANIVVVVGVGGVGLSSAWGKRFLFDGKKAKSRPFVVVVVSVAAAANNNNNKSIWPHTSSTQKLELELCFTRINHTHTHRRRLLIAIFTHWFTTKYTNTFNVAANRELQEQ